MGRRLEDDRFAYRWDWRGQLVSVTVNDAWPDGDGDGKLDVTPWAGHQVRYEYDASGRLTNRWLHGKLPAGVTDDAQRPFIEKRVFVWEGDGLAAEAAYGNSEETLLRWRKTYVPGPGGLDDAVQVAVEDAASGTTRTYTLVRDEMGTVTGLVAEDEGTAADAAKPPVPVRYRYTPYGEAHAESGPELLRARFDGEAGAAATASGTVTQVPADGAAAGSLLLDWTLPLDSGTIPAGLVVERLVGPAGWVALTQEDFVVGPAPDEGGVSSGGGGPPARLRVLVKDGWARGASYRVRLAASLSDNFGRRFGRTESLEWRIPEAEAGLATPAVTFDKRFPLSYETWEAATNNVANRFPGGQTLLFQGLWTDPVTGVAYARARWYDARNAVWLSEDPMGPADSANLYAFVGLQPNMGTDPLGLYSWAEFTEDATFVTDVAVGTAWNVVNPENAGKNLQRMAGGAVGVVKFVGETVIGLGSLALDNSPGLNLLPGAQERNRQRAEGIVGFLSHPIDTIVGAHKDAIAQIEAHEAKGEYFQSGIVGGELGAADAAAVIGAAEAGVAAARGVSRLASRALTIDFTGIEVGFSEALAEGTGSSTAKLGAGSGPPGVIVRETAHMSEAARAFQGTDTAIQVPWKNKPSPRMKDVVSFDDWDAATRQLIDRKTNVTRRPKSIRQAQRQAEVARQHGVGVRWEVPLKRVNAAKDLVNRAKAQDIIQVVDRTP